VTGCGLVGQVLIPDKSRDYFLHHNIHSSYGAHLTSYPVQSEHEADHSTPTSAEVFSVWSFTSTSLTCLHNVVLSIGATLPTSPN